MMGILICLICQLDTLEVKFQNQLQILRMFPEQSETVVQDWARSGNAVLPYLIQSFGDPQTEMFVKEKIALAFGGIKDRGVLSLLYPGLRSGSSELRANCCRAIGEIADPSSFDFVIPLLKDPNDAVRAEAIYALGKMKDTRATPNLLESLQDSVFMNRARAIVAFGDIGDKTMIPYLAVYRNDANPAIRISLAKSLGLFHDESARSVLEPMLQDDDPIVRREAYNSLTLTPGDESVELFRTSRSDLDPQVRDAACSALLNYLPETSVPMIFEFLKDGNPGVRGSAERVLSIIKFRANPGFEAILTSDRPLEMKHWALVNLVQNYGVAAVVDRLMQIYPDKFQARLEKIVHEEYEVGMGKDDLYLSLGKPSRTRSAGGETEEWDYDGLGKVFRFQSGILSGIEDQE
jgi:HEAT repeat protein